MPSEWSDLIWDMKKSIIELLDYESRCNLRICSKQNKIHVDSTKFVANKFSIKEIGSSDVHGKSIIRIDVDDFTIWFIGKDQKTKVERNWNGVLSELEDFKHENRFHVAKRYIDKFLVENDTISVNCLRLDSIKFTPLKNWKIQCQEVSSTYCRSSIRWLQQTNPKLKKLQIHVWAFGKVDEVPQLLNVSERLKVTGNLDLGLSDEQLRAIETPSIRLESSHFTLNSVKFALERFLRIGKKGDKFHVAGPSLPNREMAFKELVKNLKFKIMEIDENNDSYFTKAKITGGFENMHGLQDIREINCYFNPRCYLVKCAIWKKPNNLGRRELYMIYPFTTKETDYIGWSQFG